MQIYLTVEQDLVKVLDKLEDLGAPGAQVDTICEKIITIEVLTIIISGIIHASIDINTQSELRTHEHNLGNYFKELSSLADWYRAYAASYSYLILEIERRKKASEKQEKLYKELRKSFENAYQGFSISFPCYG